MKSASGVGDRLNAVSLGFRQTHKHPGAGRRLARTPGSCGQARAEELLNLISVSLRGTRALREVHEIHKQSPRWDFMNDHDTALIRESTPQVQYLRHIYSCFMRTGAETVGVKAKL